jgi:hypothetical protein
MVTPALPSKNPSMSSFWGGCQEKYKPVQIHDVTLRLFPTRVDTIADYL